MNVSRETNTKKYDLSWVRPVADYERNKETYLWINAGFDIETSTKYKRDDKGNVISHNSVMYIWQFSIYDKVYFGRTWEDFIAFITELSKSLYLCGRYRTCVFIHNMSFEFQFMCKELQERGLIKSIFAKEKRRPIKLSLTNGIDFIDSYSITHLSLQKLAQRYTTTQKLKGDLDYSIERSYKTELTEKELDYCRNDVLILSEYADIYRKEYMENGYMPLTATSIVRHNMRNHWEKCYDTAEKKRAYKDAICQCYPDFKNYNELLELFAGGYTHANATAVDVTNYGGVSYDKKSSYPYQLIAKYYPVSKFNKVAVNSKNFRLFLTEKCCWMKLAIYGVQAKTSVTTISKSKCEYYTNDIQEDNGRIYSASGILTRMTELDFELFEKFYTYESIKIVYMRVAERGKLPQFIINTLAEYYIKKETIDKEKYPKEYADAKANLNSCYGVMVTQVPEKEWTYNESGWDSESLDMKKEIYKQRFKQILLPQWGVWCTSHARHDLLCQVAKIVEKEARDYWYSDTDSVKCKNTEYISHLFECDNEKIRENMKQACEYYGLDFVIFQKLGTWENETPNGIEKFKTLGAKRYIYTVDSVNHATIAGLPKGALVTYCEKNNLDIYDVFRDDMKLDITDTNKLTTFYCDETSGDYYDGVYMESKSCVSLIPTTFHLGMTQDFILFLQLIKGDAIIERI